MSRGAWILTQEGKEDLLKEIKAMENPYKPVRGDMFRRHAESFMAVYNRCRQDIIKILEEKWK